MSSNPAASIPAANANSWLRPPFPALPFRIVTVVYAAGNHAHRGTHRLFVGANLTRDRRVHPRHLPGFPFDRARQYQCPVTQILRLPRRGLKRFLIAAHDNVFPHFSENGIGGFRRFPRAILQPLANPRKRHFRSRSSYFVRTENADPGMWTDRAPSGRIRSRPDRLPPRRKESD